jgi:hypothetical protein
LRFSKGEKTLVHVFKTYGSRQKALERKYKKWRSDNTKFLQTGGLDLADKKKKFLEKGLIATKKVIDLKYT